MTTKVSTLDPIFVENINITRKIRSNHIMIVKELLNNPGTFDMLDGNLVDKCVAIRMACLHRMWFGMKRKKNEMLKAQI